MWCVKCWLVKPYDKKERFTAAVRGTKPEKVGTPGRPHGRAWMLAETQPECCYCGQRFTEQNPPTQDHVIPISQGGTLGDGWVLACHLCNNARGAAPFEEYMDEVEYERIRCLHERREFRRPKWNSQFGMIETRTRAERKTARAETT